MTKLRQCTYCGYKWPMRKVTCSACGADLKKTGKSVFTKKSNPESSALYESFHSTPPKNVRKVMYENPDPKVPLVKLGRVSVINYVPEYPSKKADTEYTHTSGDTGEQILKSNLILATDEKGKNLYLIKDKKSKYPFVNERGVIG